jgi:uncharacterized protein YceK
MKSFTSALWITIALALNGCGTTLNLTIAKSRVYGGVSLDRIMIKKGLENGEASSAALALVAT